MLEDGHSGFIIGFTKNILNRLIDMKPLTPIEDTDDIWKERGVYKDGVKKSYQCKRMNSLFKDIYEDGTVRYHDVNRFICYDSDSNIGYHNGFINKIATECVGEITMPYYPLTKPIKIYTSECLFDQKKGDYDTLCIEYLEFPDDQKITIARYFKEVEDGFEEIDYDEYKTRLEIVDRKREGNDE
ncbi:hypothetical protein [Thomasclavelia spiroformis]|uniref:hypothetical protein n=1 Tax=Thomasclavelia spiroformis TaxID=29348 RepID=UPI00399262DA